MTRSIYLLFSLVSLLSSGFAFSPLSSSRSTRVGVATALNDKSAGMTEEERAIALDKATKAMTAFTNKYLENTATTLCSDKSVPAVVIKGLAEHKITLGAPLCPCRFYDDKEAEAKDGYWNCPCVPMRERHECHCMLFLTEDNAFAGEEQVRRMIVWM
jgi:ferredoxin-thioredoxin reductase catalytic chain